MVGSITANSSIYWSSMAITPQSLWSAPSYFEVRHSKLKVIRVYVLSFLNVRVYFLNSLSSHVQVLSFLIESSESSESSSSESSN